MAVDTKLQTGPTIATKTHKKTLQPPGFHAKALVGDFANHHDGGGDSAS